MRESKWYGLDVCTECEQRLTDNQRMNSGGVCPMCGYVTKGTICDTKKIVLKEIKHYKWWHIKNRKRTYKGSDVESKLWLRKYTNT